MIYRRIYCWQICFQKLWKKWIIIVLNKRNLIFFRKIIFVSNGNRHSIRYKRYSSGNVAFVYNNTMRVWALFIHTLSSKHSVKANIHSGFLTVHLFTCAEQNWSKRFKKKVGFNPTFFLNRRGSFRSTFFLFNQCDSLQWVMLRDTFKRCKQTRCQKNIFFYLTFFFCFCSIIL